MSTKQILGCIIETVIMEKLQISASEKIKQVKIWGYYQKILEVINFTSWHG